VSRQVKKKLEEANHFLLVVCTYIRDTAKCYVTLKDDLYNWNKNEALQAKKF
jgi:hypothetical protein